MGKSSKLQSLSLKPALSSQSCILVGCCAQATAGKVSVYGLRAVPGDCTPPEIEASSIRGLKMAEDFAGLAKDMLDKVGQETREKGGDRYYTWSEHFNVWLELFLPHLGGLSEFEKYNSLWILKLAELQHLIGWVMISVLYGKYHQAIRELRYILDSMAQAYYLDAAHPAATITGKLEILKDIEKQAFGSRLIDKLDVDHKPALKSLYSALSKYAHSSYEELAPLIEEGKVEWRVTFAFDEQQFNSTVEFTNKVMDAVYLMIFGRFPDAARRVSGRTRERMEELECSLSLSHLEAT
jgi:hypothetical protein